MSKQTIALIYNFLEEKDSVCAEIFKRGFQPDSSSIVNFPPLDNIIQQFIKSTKKNEKKVDSSVEGEAESEKKIMEIAQQNPSKFLEQIVQKRKEAVTSSESECDQSKTESESESDEKHFSAQKRQKIDSGAVRKFFKRK